MIGTRNKFCFIPCSLDKIASGGCECYNSITPCVEGLKESPKICPNCGNDKLIDIAEELDGGYKCVDCGIRFKIEK